jgi:drug/metabolite transporter (DMT)-like permease
MHQDIVIASLAGTGGMLGWGLADFFAKKTIDEIGDTASLVWGHLFGTVSLVIMALCRWLWFGQSVALPIDVKTWSLLAVFGAVQAAVYLFVYKGFAKGQLAVLNPIFASFAGITALLSITFFGEPIGFITVFGLMVLFFGIILISTDFAALKAKRLLIGFSHISGFREIVTATLLAALWTLFWDRFIGGADWLVYALLMYAFMTITILLVALIQKVTLRVENRSVWKFLVLIGLCETIAYLAISWGYSTTPLTSVVALLSGAFSLPTIILARLFLKERITALQTAGGIVIIAGIMLLALV